MVTRIAGGGADKLEGDAVADELAEIVEKGGVEVIEVKDVLLHENNGALDLHGRSCLLLLLLRIIELAGDGVDEFVKGRHA